MTSKKTLLTTCALLLIGLSACDDKPEGEARVDAGVDATKTAQKAQKKAEAEQPSASKNAPDPEKRTSASSPKGATVAEEPPLDISKLLTTKDFEDFTRTSMVREQLVGKPPSPTYNAVHLHPSGRNFYGAGLQVWKAESSEAAVERALQLREQYLAVEDAPKDGPVDNERAFVSDRAGILTYVFPFSEGDQSYVLAVSCGEKLCKKGFEDVAELAEVVVERLGESEE
jgi:hypothetical protein